jgi:hypothetical protein
VAVATPRRERAQLNPMLVAVAAGAVAFVFLAAYVCFRVYLDGIGAFFHTNDSAFFRATAADPFGNGHTIHLIARSGEAAYRYGRILLPFCAWVTALGHPGAVQYTLVFWNIAGIAACVTFGGLLLDATGGDASSGPIVLLAPGLAALIPLVYAEPVSIACILAGYWLLARHRPGWGIAALAAATLARETAVLALLPLVWDAARRRDAVAARRVAYGFVPLGAWYLWVWVRIGQLPVFAHTPARSEAIGWPLVSLAHFAADTTQPDRFVVVTLVVLTSALCVSAWARDRGRLVGQAALLFGLFALCLGPNALRYSGDTLRLLGCAQVLGIIVYAGSQRLPALVSAG